MKAEIPAVPPIDFRPWKHSEAIKGCPAVPLALVVLASLALPSAALDANGDGISDVWAAMYPAAASNPNGDHDGDGVQNFKEGLAWTDPNDPSSVLASSFQLDENTLAAEWPTERWNRYRVMLTDDLSFWKRDGLERLSSGTPMNYGETAIGPKRFLKIHQLNALNSDTDALSNLEEEKLGTDPENWDSDGDKVADDIEFLLGTNPNSNIDSGDGLPSDWKQWIISHNSSDSVVSNADVTPTTDFDGDGVLDGEEFTLGTNPTVKRRHIVFFMTEDQGYHLGCYGTEGLSTPKIDALAAQGVLFHRAFAGGSVCSVGKMSLLTGTFPHTHSGYRNTSNYNPYSGGQSRYPLTGDPSSLSTGGVHEDLPTLIEILKDRGWFTMITHKTHAEPVRKFPYSLGGPSCGSPAATRENIREAVAAAGKRPMFIYLSVGSPHLPFASLANSNNIPDISGPVEIPNCYPTNNADVRENFVDYYRSIQAIDSIYDAAVDEMNDLDDTAIGGASPPSLAESTTFVFTSDHGMGLHRAKQSCYGMGFHVPLIFHGLGVAPNVELSLPVSQIDLSPTFLAYDGIPQPPSMIGKNLQPLLDGTLTEFPDRRTILTSNHHRYDARAVNDGRYYYIRNLRQPTGSWNNPGPSLNADQYTSGSPWNNLVYDACKNSPQNEKPYKFLDQLVNGKLPGEELYDMGNDLWMVDNLIDDPAYAAILAELRGEMTRWRDLSEDYNDNVSELVRRSTRYQEPGSGGGTEPDPDNAVLNPSFESGTANWSFTGGTAAHFTVENSTLATDGGFIANIRGLHSMTSESGLKQLTDLDVEVGTYTLTLDAAKAAADATSLNVAIYRGSPNNVLKTADLTVSETMQSFTVTYDSGSSATGKLGLRLLPGGAGGATNRIALDNLSLTFEAP